MDKYKKDYEMVLKRLGKTTGASKGKKPLPKPSLKLRPSKTKVRLKYEKKL